MELIIAVLRLLLVFVCVGALYAAMLSQVKSDSELLWQRYSKANEEFTFESPFDFDYLGDSDSKSSRQYFGSINGVYLYAFSDPLKKPKLIPTVAEFIRTANQSLTIPDQTFTRQLVEFRDQFGYFNRIMVVKSDTRLYLFQAVSEWEQNLIAGRYINSVAFGTKLVAQSPPSNPIAEAQKELNPENEKSVQKQEPSLGAGSGRGSGVGSGSAEPKAQDSRPTASTPLKIKSTPKPSYTDLARFYQIKGLVQTRVTFLASGEIGSVTAVTRLPFGLVERAINAAKSMKFEPATRDGKTVSITRMVEYSFLIY